MKSSDPIKRIQFGTAAALGFALFGLWLAGSSSFESLQLSQTLPIQRPDINLLWPILALVGVILGNALFGGAETAVELLRPLHVKHLKEKNAKKGERLQSLIDKRIAYIATCRLGSYAALTAIGVLSFLLAPHLADRLNWPGYPLLLAAFVLIFVPILGVSLIVELIPKSYAAMHPHGVAGSLYPFIIGTSYIFWFPEKFVTGVANLVTKRFGGRATFAVANQTEEEIKTLVETGEESGEIESDERELLHSVFEFTDTVAREVMTPRVDLDAVPLSSEPGEVLQVIKESGHSRIPIYEDTDDQIIGIIHAKDLFMAMLEDGCSNLPALMRKPMFVPENKNLHELLTEMRASRNQMAIVQDEFGGTSGVVTIEDIVEELVGDIVDEYDEEEPPIIPDGEGWLVDGKVRLDDLNDAVRSDFDSEEFDTVGGFVFGIFGRQPDVGEGTESDGYRFVVAETDGKRIARLRIERSTHGQVLEEEQV